MVGCCCCGRTQIRRGDGEGDVVLFFAPIWRVGFGDNNAGGVDDVDNGGSSGDGGRRLHIGEKYAAMKLPG